MVRKYEQVARTQIDTSSASNQAGALSYKHQAENQAANETARALGAITEGVTRIAGATIDYRNEQIKKENDEIIKKAAIAGELSVSAGQYHADLMSGDGVYEKAYNEAAKAAAYSQVRNYANERVSQIAAESQDDPVAFRAKIDSLSESINEELKLGDEARVILARTIDEGYARYNPKIVVSGYAAAKNKELKAYNQTMESTINIALNDIRAGDFSRIESLYADWGDVFDEGVKRGIYSEEDKHDVFKGVMLEANEQMLMSYADAARDSNNFDGARKTIAAWRETTSESGQFTPDQIDVIEGRAQEAINKAEYAHMQKLKSKKKEIDAANKLQKQVDIVKSSIDNGYALPKNKDNQNAVDAFYKQFMTDFDIKNPEHVQAVSQIVSRTKLIPTQVIEGLDRATLSGDVESLNGAAEMYKQLKEQSPLTLANSSDIDTAAFYESYTRLTRSGMGQEEARDTAYGFVYKQDKSQQEVIKQRMTRKEYTSERAKAAQGAFDERAGGFFSPDDLVDLGDVGVEYEADYNTLFDAFYQKTGGDVSAAKSLTNDRIQRKWSVTDINGDWQPMRFSPESIYGGDGDNDWIKTQWQEHDMPEIKKLNGIDEGAELRLVPHAETGRSKPTWKVVQVVKGENGELLELKDVTDKSGASMTWYPDWATYSERMGIGEAAEKRLEKAKQQWEANTVMERKGATVPRAYGYFPDLPQKNSTKFMRGF